MATEPAQMPNVGSLGWRILVATWAHRFFGLIHDKAVAELIGQPQDAGQASAWPLAYFTLYLQKRGVPGDIAEVNRILTAMERASLLFRAGWRTDMTGWPAQGQLYIAQGVTSKQTTGNLWLSEVIGADLIIQSYKAVTVQISGGEGKGTGTGLILDRSHVVTNRHVIEGLVGHGIGHEIEVHPSFKPPDAQWVSRQSHVVAHQDVDIAVITAEVGANEGFPSLPGMVFRDPRWDDEVRVFGYPQILGVTEQPITVEHGDVVNPDVLNAAARPITVERGDVVSPAAESPAVGGEPRQKIFLTSAIERPGNSGGPVVARDGRVVGLVIDHTRAGVSTSALQAAEAQAGVPPFYRGIPSGEVVRALTELGFADLVAFE